MICVEKTVNYKKIFGIIIGVIIAGLVGFIGYLAATKVKSQGEAVIDDLWS